MTEDQDNPQENIARYNNYIYLKSVISYPVFLKYKKILVLDDDINQLKLIKSLLSTVGLKPFCIQRSEHLKKGLQQNPQLILLDLYLEEGKVDDICHEIKTSPNYSEIPIVFISASSKREDIVGALDKGGNDYIKKPFFFEELLARVGVQFRIHYMYDEIRKYLNVQEELSRKLLNLLDQSRMQKQEIERMNRLLKQKSITDPLTQVFNRGYLFQVLRRELARAKRYDEQMSMIMFDIDFFKEVNDTYGHVVGDQVLRGVADIIRKRVRTSDMVSRYGGEEFVVLLTNTDRENARKVAEEIRENMEKISFKTKEGEKIKITLSGGVTDYRKGEEMDDFFIRLDQNLYHAKRNGRNRIISDGQEKE